MTLKFRVIILERVPEFYNITVLCLCADMLFELEKEIIFPLGKRKRSLSLTEISCENELFKKDFKF